MNKIQLSEAERNELESYIRRGKANARDIKRAHILLKSAESWSIERIAETFETSQATVSNVRTRYHVAGLEGVLQDKGPDQAPSGVRRHGRSGLGGNRV